MLHYLLQVIAFQLIFLLVFELFLKKETFFSYNRVYLLVTPVLAMLLPLLQIPMLQTTIPAENVILLQEVFIGANPEIATSEQIVSNAPEAEQSINWWLLAYCAGLLFNFGLFFHKYRVLKQLFAHKTVLQNNEMKIVEVPDSNIACTFYNTIFLGSQLLEKEREQILPHEIIHVRQRHTLDLLFFELLKIIFWFDPIIYIYQSRISALHEYIADATVVKKVRKQDYFQQLLNSAFNTQDISFLNQFFNHSLIKKRIIMLQKTKSTTVSKLKFLVIIPLMLAMLFYVACSQNEAPISKEDMSVEKKELQRNPLMIEEIVVENGPHNSQDVMVKEVTVLSECENLTSRKDLEECMSQKIKNLVHQNFNPSLGKQLGLEGINRIYVQFRINDDGIVEFIGSKAPHPTLQKEAERVVNLIPQMTPGENIAAQYTLPITLRIKKDQ